MEDFLDAKCTAACWNVGPRPAVTANIAYWSLLRGKSGPPTEVGRSVGRSVGQFVLTPEPPKRTRLVAHTLGISAPFSLILALLASVHDR